MKVFLLGGQSNMVGAGNTAELEKPYSEPQADVKIWRGGGWADLGPAGKTLRPPN